VRIEGGSAVAERPHFVVHNEADTVGVVVVEDARAEQDLIGWIMETNRTVRVTALADIPLGHKVAIKPMRQGETVLKYEHDIGRAVEDIPVGGYVHAHNIKTKRW
jgi:(2R)-sulfolactate sulfo-lyase subunit alpha